MSKNWAINGNQHYLRDVSGLKNQIKPGIYRLEVNPQTDEFYLAYVQDKFEFPYKIYTKDEGFVDWVHKTYINTKGNLGILLNGTKGTGKTVTAEQIGNRLNLPVILVTRNYTGMESYFNDFEQDIVIFFDEFEKIFDQKKEGENAGGNILSIMDGTLNGTSRKVFLLTTNDTYINKNLLDRPSRIRYFREYKDLELSVILQIVQDKLEAVEFKDQVIQFISELKIITIDIVKSIIEEVNIHKVSPYEFQGFFNVETLAKKKDVIKVISIGNEELIQTKVQITPVRFNDEVIGKGFCWRRSDHNYWQSLGEILEVIDESTLIINESNPEYDEDEADTPDNQPLLNNRVVYRIDDAPVYHSAFTTFNKSTMAIAL